MDVALSGGFARPAEHAARAFRACLQAMARPGRIYPVTGAEPPAPLSPAAGTILLTLADSTTPLHLAPSHDTPAIRQWIAFHCAAPLTGAGTATFVVGNWAAMQPVDRFARGTADYPDRSATLIIEMEEGDPNARLTGPGIETAIDARLPEITAFEANNAVFPLGFDCYLTHGDRISALPRSTRVEAL